MKQLIVLLTLALTLALAGCATTQTGNETASVRHSLSRIAENNRKAIGEGKRILDDLQGAERDAKELRQILQQLPRK